MRWPIRVLALLLLFTTAAVATDKATSKAKQLYKDGLAAETKLDYVTAYNLYHQAYELKSSELTYRASFERVRFLASASLVHQGELLVNAGQLQEALTDFERALGIDPSSFIAQQEISKVHELLQKSQQEQSNPPPQSPTSALHKRMEQAGGPVELAPISDTPITLRLSEDSKTIYESIGKLAGINVLFDPDYTSRRIRVDLNGVTLQQALEITALESKTFWRPVTPNTIFIAADTPAKRKELEQNVIRTFYLTNLSQPNELQDLVNILRTLLDTQRLQQFPSQQAIVVRGTPDQIAMAEKLINDLDKSRPEVVVEVVIMQVQRNKLQNLGIQPPPSASITVIDNTSTTNTATGTNVGTGSGTVSTTSGSTPGTINLNSLAHLNATNFQVTIGSATAYFLYTDSSSKILQQPQIRALDGQKASLKLGQRVPVATGSFQPGIGGVGINPLVNTQFNYIDVGVNVDITPRIHGLTEVTLKIAMDISAVDSYQNIGGIQQPVIGQRKIEQEIRLKEGEANIMGGILEETDTKNLQGIPGLAQIPFFRYLFSNENKNRIDNELVFMLVPHIVRAQEISGANTREIDIGTANVIQLRRPSILPESTQVINSPGVSGRTGAVQPPTQQRQALPQGQQPPAQQAPAQTTPPATAPQPQSQAQPQDQPPAAGPQGGAVVSFDPATLNQAVGSTFTVNVGVVGAQNVNSVPLQITYNPAVLQLLNVSNGPLLEQDGQPVALVHRDDAMAGIVQLTGSRPPGAPGVSGNGSVFTLTFQAKAVGQSTLSINRAQLKNAAMQSIPATGSQAIVTVH